MDILIQDSKAHELFPDGSPELHPSILIIKDYQGQVEEGWDWNGSTFTAPPEPEVVAPQSISMRQCRLQLLADGLLQTVEDQIAVMDDTSKITWEYATVVERNDPLTGVFKIILGLTDEQMDTMFMSASAL